jgi:hypothetical protein
LTGRSAAEAPATESANAAPAKERIEDDFNMSAPMYRLSLRLYELSSEVDGKTDCPRYYCGTCGVPATNDGKREPVKGVFNTFNVL